MNTQNDHAHVRIETLNKKNDRSESGAYLGIKRSMHLKRKRVSAQLRNNLVYVIEQNKSIMYDRRINQSIIKSHMSGSHQNPFILHELISQIPLFWSYEKFIHAY